MAACWRLRSWEKPAHDYAPKRALPVSACNDGAGWGHLLTGVCCCLCLSVGGGHVDCYGQDCLSTSILGDEGSLLTRVEGDGCRVHLHANACYHKIPVAGSKAPKLYTIGGIVPGVGTVAWAIRLH